MAGTEIPMETIRKRINTFEIERGWKERLTNSIKFGAFSMALGIVISIGPVVQQAQTRHETISEFVVQDSEYAIALGAASSLLFVGSDIIISSLSAAAPDKKDN